MSNRRFYVTTSIPYVNGEPHVGFALELVQADVLARHRRRRGDDVRFGSGTDDNALKNVKAAEAAGTGVSDFVERNAARFAALQGPLQLSYDSFIRTGSDARHRAGVERLWRACERSGDLYLRDYEGLYCVGCEAFLAPGEDSCAEHSGAPERVRERNWFFRLSRYGDALAELLDTKRLRIEPEARRAEAIAFVRGGLADFSVSRAKVRARGWGIPVPGDAGQVVYVWFDALANYLTSLGDGALREQWWSGSAERVHVIGKGILRFHAVWWPAILLSAAEPLPTAIFVHDYVSVDGRKLSKSSGGGAEPAALVKRFGSDALRWWLLREPRRTGDCDFRVERLVARSNAELANGLGNLVARTAALLGRSPRRGTTDAPAAGRDLEAALARLEADVDRALARFDFHTATDALWRVVVEANRFLTETRPWRLESGPELDGVLSLAERSCYRLSGELEPFLPAGARRLTAHLRGTASGPPFRRLAAE